MVCRVYFTSFKFRELASRLLIVLIFNKWYQELRFEGVEARLNLVKLLLVRFSTARVLAFKVFWTTRLQQGIDV